MGETCSHVAATLFKIEAAVRYGLTVQTCTDVPCQWNRNFTSSVQPSPITDIKFYSESALKKVGVKRKRDINAQPKINDLLDLLKERNLTQTVGLSLFEEHQAPFVVHVSPKKISKLPKNLSLLYNVSNKQLTEDELNQKCNDTIQNLSVKIEEAEFLEESTRNQADNLVWHQQRVGRITGSTIYSFAHTSVDNPSKSLIKKICSFSSCGINTPSLSWGRDNEQVALLTYFNTISDPDYFGDSLCLNTAIEIHTEPLMSDSGLVVKPNEPWFGASPDSLITCSCCGKGAVEVKCPFTLKDVGLENAINSGSFYVKKEQSFILVKNHSYYYQVQHEMYVCNVSYCDFVVWTPIEFVVVRIKIDEEFTATIHQKCFEMWKKIILPNLLCNSPQEKPSTSTSKNKIYCICKQPYDENKTMIGCDKCDDWFHLECLNLKNFPNAKKWYCKRCKSGKK